MTFKVCVIGAAGGIGQPLSLLLKRNNNITQLSLYDVSQSLKGVAMDLSHIDSPTLVSYDCGEESSSIYKALQGARIVVILAGVTRKPGMTRDDIFTLNAGIIRKAAENIANACPEAMCCIVTNPVNSLVPVFIETLKSFNISECERRVFGVTKLDCSRANTFISEEKNIPLEGFQVPIVGGHSEKTIVPLFSKLTNCSLTQEETDRLFKKLRSAGSEIVEAKKGQGSATLSIADATARFVDSIITACTGKEVEEFCYVKTNLIKGVDYFATRVSLGPKGITKIHELGSLSEYEETAIKDCVKALQQNINTALEYTRIDRQDK